MQPLDEIYSQYGTRVYKYLLSLTGSEDLAEELTQETFYQAIKSINRYDESCSITTWLCAIAKNQLASYRRKHPETEEIEKILTEERSAEQEALAAEDRVHIYKLIHSLEPPFSEVLYLRLLGDLSFREIGEISGKTENWARVTYYRGKEKLKGELLKYEK